MYSFIISRIWRVDLPNRDNSFVKSIPHRKWSVKEDGTLCIDENGKACRKKYKVIKVEEKYLSIKKGKVAFEWQLAD